MNSSGKNKMSFELDFKGGKIWCEHLDSMGSHEDEVIDIWFEKIKKAIENAVGSVANF